MFITSACLVLFSLCFYPFLFFIILFQLMIRLYLYIYCLFLPVVESNGSGICLGSNHTDSLPRSQPRFFFRGDGGRKLAQPETPDTSRAVADWMAGQLSGTC